jgi:hypothetical protein
MTLDISDFHLNNPMERYEYLHITLAANPTCSMEEYKLEPLIHNGFIAVELRQGIYGLPQAGTVVNIQLQKQLSQHAPRIYKHTTRSIIFSLCVEDFGVKYAGRENAEHLRDNFESKIQYHHRLDRHLPLPGTTKHTKLTSLCLAMLPRCSKVSASGSLTSPALSTRLATHTIRRKNTTNRQSRHFTTVASSSYNK